MAMSDPHLVIYHANCYDGFTAAFIADDALLTRGVDVELHPARYGEPPPDVAGRDVLVVDFSYPREAMEAMHADAASLLVLDHHATAEEACRDLPFCQFDMERSGCGMTWDHFHPDQPRPFYVQRIEDRDLWRMAFEDTPFVHAYVAALPMTLDAWAHLASQPPNTIVAQGSAINAYIQRYCEKAAGEARVVEIEDTQAVVLNVPYQNASELADYLLKRFPDVSFAAGYFQRADRRWQFSLRSRSDFDVSEIAKAFGGGGHRQAAGFDVANLAHVLGDQ